jgi:Xaa-Pro dipeptidase
MALFVHTIVLDSESGTAMTLGQTYLTTTDTPKPLSRYGLDFIEV